MEESEIEESESENINSEVELSGSDEEFDKIEEE